MRSVIAFWGRQLDCSFETRFAPYNQLQQTLLDPHGEFAANHHGVNVALARLEDLGSTIAAIETNLTELIHLVRDASTRLSAPVILCLCPESPAFLADPAHDRLAREAAARLSTSLDDVPGAQFIHCDQIRRLYPVADPHDPDAERLGRIPYTELFFCALGTALVRHAHALFLAPYKVIALDCDNTLWQGICGEDGPQGIVLDPPRRALQEFMLAQRDAGMLLAMVSKNNEQDVLDTFAQNPQMPLQLRHFVAWRLNWDSKSDNLASVGEELSLGLDSFIFVDDNPKECAEVEDGVPEALALALPAEPTGIPLFLEHVWAFDHPVITEEDRHRNVYYEQTQQFGREARRAANLGEFMAALGLETRFSSLADERLSRVAQLTQRTNQFNFTTIRRTEAEIQSLIREQGYECVTVEVSDRFGDYGLVGVLLFQARESALAIDTFLLSCRALGRGVEHRMLAWLGAEASRRGMNTVEARLNVTAKNAPARQFLHSVGASVERTIDDGFEYVFPAESLAGLTWKPAAAAKTAQPTPAPKRSTSRKLAEYARIACDLAAPAQILEAMRHETRAANGAVNGAMSEIEGGLAAIWTDLLQKPVERVSDNFFDLGGHSLLAVLMILRVKEAFGVELPIDDVYSATLTLGELARKIETYQLARMNPEEYAALLAEIEGLTDEEVQQLLADEEREGSRP